MTRSRSGQWLFGALTILILLIPLFFLSEQKISAAARPTISARLTTSSKYQGGTATVTASAAYGTAPYRYRFVYKVNGGRWVTIRNYSTTAKASFVYHTVGNYVVRSFVMDKSGLAAYYDLSFTVLEKELPLTNESTISAVKLNLGQTLSIAGKATGGTKPYYYAYYYTEYGSSQVTIQKKSTVSTASVKLPKAGYYSIKVIIWDGTGKSATKLFNITVSTVTGTALKNSSSISSAIIEAGGTITINGVGTGGTQPYLYSYSYSQDGIDYKTINSWTKFNSRTLKLTTPGYDKIKVTVKDLSGKSVTKTISVTCKRTTGRTLVNTSAIETTPITDGIRVHLIGSAYGGTEPYRYAFYYTLNNGKQKKCSHILRIRNVQ